LVLWARIVWRAGGHENPQWSRFGRFCRHYQYKREAEGRGDSYYTSETGKAKGAEIEAVGLARARAAEELRKAVGEQGTTFVNIIDAVMKGDKKIMPDILVAGGSGALDGLSATLMKFLTQKVIPENQNES
jgi:hypothetical protein